MSHAFAEVCPICAVKILHLDWEKISVEKISLGPAEVWEKISKQKSLFENFGEVRQVLAQLDKPNPLEFISLFPMRIGPLFKG